MKFEARLFLLLAPFFVFVAFAYGWWSGWESVGTAALLLVGGLVLMIGAYLALVARRIDPRPEDDPYAEVEQGAGEQGVFSPGSWWPLVAAAGAAITFLSLAVGWWLIVLGLAVGTIGLVGWIMEYSRGQHAH
jgi:hypothetical protein